MPIVYFVAHWATASDGVTTHRHTYPNLCSCLLYTSDINWIRRLTLSQNNAKEMLDALVIGGELSYNVRELSGEFNKKKFFEKEFYPVSLFYLGMTTLKLSLIHIYIRIELKKIIK